MTAFEQGMQSVDGQNHDRLQEHIPASLPSTMAAGNDLLGEPVVEITAPQRMMSAISGSLLTGLLMTPLDVVRVRWQSQGVKQAAASAATDFSKLAISTPNAFRPSNLGVTACCREVFFMNNTSEVCVVGPRPEGSLGGAGGAGAVECAVEQTQRHTFNSTIDGLRKIARNEGFFTLWRGLSPTLLMAIPGNIIYFTGYEWLRFDQASPIQRAGIRDEFAPLASGITARTVAATAVGPIELFRTRLMASHGETASGHLVDTFRGIKEMVGTDGYRALWRGLTLTLWRDVPFSGMYWWGYEYVRGRLTDARARHRGQTLDLNRESRGRSRRRSQSRENHTETFTDSFIAGAASGSFASIATMPFDVGKTRTQVYRDGKVSAAAAGAERAAIPEEQNMIRLLWHIFRTEGMPGLFKGWIPRTLKVAPACAIMISSYEVGKRVFRGMNERALIRERERRRHDD